MQLTNNEIIIIIAIVTLILLTLLTIKNIRDRKKVLPPNSLEDIMNEKKTDGVRKRDRI